MSNEEQSLLRISSHHFRVLLLNFIPAFIGVRYAFEWLTSEDNASFFAWVNDRWIFDFVIVVLIAAVQALMQGYKTWLGPSYVEWRRSSGND